MKQTLKEMMLGAVIAVVAVGISAAILVGCTTQNPQYTPILPGQPNTNTVPQYIPNPGINGYSNTVASVANTVAPLNPYAGLTDWAIRAGFGLFGGISYWVARQKSGALNTMAAAVVQSGAHPAVLDAAGNTPHFTAIADAINNNLGVNQTLNANPPVTPKV